MSNPAMILNESNLLNLFLNIIFIKNEEAFWSGVEVFACVGE
jgi:hypothetical protein